MAFHLSRIPGFQIYQKLLNKKIDPIGLSYFRMAYSLVLFLEVLQILYFKHLIFDKIPYIEPSEVDFSVALIAWLVAILFLFLGFRTKTAAIVNYLFSLTFIATIRSFEYHMFYVYMGINFLMIFLAISEDLSLDQFLKKKVVRKVTVLNYYIPVLLAIGFVYIDSVFYKIISHNWTTGLGMWLPSSLPYASVLYNDEILNLKFVSLMAGIGTIIFEGIFIFVFFLKGFRVPLFVIGVGLHLGILLTFPIPLFGLGVIAIYLLMVPVSWWRRTRESVFQDGINISHSSSVKIFIAISVLFLLQVNVTLFGDNLFKKVITKRPYISRLVENGSKTFFGITAHPVFMDDHFKDYYRYYAIKALLESGNTFWLPIVNEDGSPGLYNWGFNWVKWTFRVSGPDFKLFQFQKGVRDFSTFWAHKKNIPLETVRFEILEREIKTPKEWVKNYLVNERKKEWKRVGVGYWEEGQFILKMGMK